MKKSHVMSRTTASLFVLVTLLLASCKKDNDTAATVTEADAADVVTQAVVASSGGITVQTADVARISNIYVNACGASKDSSIAYVSAPNAAITYSFTASWHWAVTCGATPHLDFTYNGNTVYDAPRMSSNDHLAVTAAVTGLASTAYVLNMQVTRNGTQVSKIRNKNSFTSLLTLTGTNVAVNKQTQLVESGTLAVTLTGSGSGGRSFSYAGTLVFNGNKKGTLTLNSGATYAIEW
jgi:hypothetical protein